MKKIIFKTCLSIVFGMYITGCKPKKTDITPEEQNKKDLNAYVSGLRGTDIETSLGANPIVQGSPLIDAEGSTYCKTTKYIAGPEYDEGFLLDPSTDVIYPGAILDGNSIKTGGYTSITLPRSGGTISTNIQNIQGGIVTEDLTETTKSKATQAISNLISRGGTAPASMNFEIIKVYSENQLNAALSFSFGNEKKLQIKGAFNYNSTSAKSRAVVKFQQKYFNVAYDPKSKPADYFKPEVTANDLKTVIGNTTISPVYVSSVTYGRIAFYTFESSLSEKELNASLEVAFQGAVSSGELDASLKSKVSNSNTTIKGFILGGNGANAAATINGIDELYKYITTGGDYSATSLGLPVSYKLSKLSDNSTFKMVKTTEYTVRDCDSFSGGIRLNSFLHVTGDQANNMRGTINISLGYDSETAKTAYPAIFSTGNNVSVPTTSGLKYELSTPATNTVVYNPAKYNEAYITFSINLYNETSIDLGCLGTYNQGAGTTFEKKVYLKDINTSNGNLGTGWSVNGSGPSREFSLTLDFPRSATRYRKATASCNENREAIREVSSMYANFSMDIKAP